MSRANFALILAAVCVVAGAATVSAAEPAKPTAFQSLDDLGGRWQGHFRAFGAKRVACSGEGCNTLTLDVSRCGEGWCGVEVATGGACGTTALKIGAGKRDGGQTAFEGTLQLAERTEPYTVRISGHPGEAGKPATLWAVGDTGGSLRMLRRTFPFEAQLARQGEASCKPEHKTS